MPHTTRSVSPHGQGGEETAAPFPEGEKGGGDSGYGERVPHDGGERDDGGGEHVPTRTI